MQQMIFTDEELDLIKNTYKGNERLLKLLRKVFLPEYDPNAPLGQIVHYPWIGMEALSQMAPQDREVFFLSTMRLNQHIERQLLVLSALAGKEEENEELKIKKAKANSTK